MSELSVDDEALALDEIKAVGPGGNHLARPYTRKHFRQIWQSDLLDTTPHDRWEAEGVDDAARPPAGARGGAPLRAARLRARTTPPRPASTGCWPRWRRDRPGT